ncbi:hypothetical protein AM593_04670, partial [Mytilus galloprovincialis]
LLETIGFKSQTETIKTDEQEFVKPWKKCLLFRHIILLISGLIILTTRWRIMGSTTPTFQVFDNPHSFVNGSLYRVRTFIILS